MELSSLYDPEHFRKLGHQLVDLLADHVKESIHHERPVLRWKDPAIRRDFWAGALSNRSLDFESLVKEILDQSITLHSPAYMGHQNAPALPTAALADLLVSVTNSSSAIYEMGSATTMIEKATTAWMCRHLGFTQGDGIFTSGGSLGNLTALLAARQSVTGQDVWKEGGTKKLAILSSGFSHYSVKRAAQIMGLGQDSVFELEVDECFRVLPQSLESTLDRATRQGYQVFACVASSCNTALGTYDPLEPIVDFCIRHGLWLHVDGAHGASALLSHKYRNYLAGIEGAQSVLWDAHKMLMMPALTTAVLFKSENDSYRTFSQAASYLFEKNKFEEWYNLSHRTLECTKPAFSTRLYFALMLHGEEPFGDYVTRQYDRAREFADRIERHPSFEIAIRPESNIVCFRYIRNGVPVSDEGQREIRRRTIQRGHYYLVQTQLPRGAYLRTTLMNPFTRSSDLEGLLTELESVAKSGSFC